MGKQINLYLNQEDINKIQNYLSKRNFVLLKDEFLSTPQPVYADTLLGLWEIAGYVGLSNSYISYRNFEYQEQQKFRINALRSETIECTFFDQKESIYRLRFYYGIEFLEATDKQHFKNPDFGIHVERFFRWLRRTFVRVPNMPTFYQNPNFPVKEVF